MNHVVAVLRTRVVCRPYQQQSWRQVVAEYVALGMQNSAVILQRTPYGHRSLGRGHIYFPGQMVGCFKNSEVVVRLSERWQDQSRRVLGEQIAKRRGHGVVKGQGKAASLELRERTAEYPVLIQNQLWRRGEVVQCTQSRSVFQRWFGRYDCLPVPVGFRRGYVPGSLLFQLQGQWLVSGSLRAEQCVRRQIKNSSAREKEERSKELECGIV